MPDNRTSETWTIYNKSGDFDGLCERFGISPITARLLVNRGLSAPDEIESFLNPKQEDLHNPHLLKNLDGAVDLICAKIAEGKKLRVIGDYDVDGINSTYILTDALERAGAIVDNYIPHRVRDGYGLNPSMIESAAADGIDTVITCDNGISAVSAAELAASLGMTLIVTDHHEIPDELPRAAFIVNPKQKDDTYPCHDICGAVVAAKLALALFERLGMSETVDTYIEFMALATICDVVPLRGENRTIASLGLKKLRHTDNPGLRALMQASSLDMLSVSEYHAGFVIGPCFNATGRIDDASIALDMLLAKDSGTAAELANRCFRLNEERKSMTAEQERVAYDILDSCEDLQRVIVLVLPDCHESILGIIAGRIKERYNRPSIVLTRTETCLKGSARSIPAYNMFEELKGCADLLTKFGGHPMAAGLSLPFDKLEEFNERLNANCSLTPADMQRKLMIEAEVSFSMFGDRELEELALFSPFGQDNAAPLFAERGLKVMNIRYLGRDNSFLRFRLLGKYGPQFTAVCFLDAATVVGDLRRKYGDREVDNAFYGAPNSITLTAAYVPKANDFRDVHEIQMQIKALKI